MHGIRREGFVRGVLHFIDVIRSTNVFNRPDCHCLLTTQFRVHLSIYLPILRCLIHRNDVACGCDGSSPGQGFYSLLYLNA